ncbi:uncharacterized protein LOC143907665 [Temnothorax americanus]|uniref:uncharacterized protein LOC143907665 n=1 Tax=Temnothorax americanus TaxID=1964332 RepID=UPI004068D5A0
MSSTQLENLLQIVGPKLQKQTHIREPISAEERLCLTLRYLASGDSMVLISYQYLLGCTTISNIISETCEAIWNMLCPVVLPSSLTKEDWLRQILKINAIFLIALVPSMENTLLFNVLLMLALHTITINTAIVLF